MKIQFSHGVHCCNINSCVIRTYECVVYILYLWMCHLYTILHIYLEGDAGPVFGGLTILHLGGTFGLHVVVPCLLVLLACTHTKNVSTTWTRHMWTNPASSYTLKVCRHVVVCCTLCCTHTSHKWTTHTLTLQMSVSSRTHIEFVMSVKNTNPTSQNTRVCILLRPLLARIYAQNERKKELCKEIGQKQICICKCTNAYIYQTPTFMSTVIYPNEPFSTHCSCGKRTPQR